MYHFFMTSSNITIYINGYAYTVRPNNTKMVNAALLLMVHWAVRYYCYQNKLRGDGYFFYQLLYKWTTTIKTVLCMMWCLGLTISAKNECITFRRPVCTSYAEQSNWLISTENFSWEKVITVVCTLIRERLH